MQGGVGVVDLGLVGGADGAALLVEEHHALVEGRVLMQVPPAGRASWLTAAPKTHGSRAAAGTSARRTGGCAVARRRAWVSSSWRSPSRRARAS